MRRKKLLEAPPQELSMQEAEEIEAAATVFTWLLSYVNPSISREATYDILLGAFMSGIGMENVRDIGTMIRKTSQYGSSQNKH